MGFDATVAAATAAIVADYIQTAIAESTEYRLMRQRLNAAHADDATVITEEWLREMCSHISEGGRFWRPRGIDSPIYLVKTDNGDFELRAGSMTVARRPTRGQLKMLLTAWTEKDEKHDQPGAS